MTKAESLIRQIQDADEADILAFDFEPLFQHLRELDDQVQQKNKLLHECYQRLKQHDNFIALHDQTAFMEKLERTCSATTI